MTDVIWPQSLLILLRRPASLMLSHESAIPLDDSDMRIGEMKVLAGYPDKLSFPDVVIDVPTRTFIGLAFNSSAWTDVLTLFRSLDERVVYFLPDDNGEPRLDIRWGVGHEVTFEGAQLADVLFYSSVDAVGQQFQLVALELDHIDEILDDYGLTFPTHLQLAHDEVTWISSDR